MKISKIVAISAVGILLSACNANQMQKEPAASSSAPSAPSTGAPHVHNVQGHGDLNHKHQGNSSPSHGHSWADIQKELTMMKK